MYTVAVVRLQCGSELPGELIKTYQIPGTHPKGGAWESECLTKILGDSDSGHQRPIL